MLKSSQASRVAQAPVARLLLGGCAMRISRLLASLPAGTFFLSFLLLLFSIFSNEAVGQSTLWSHQIAAPPGGTIWPLSIAVDGAGDTVVGGWFQIGADFGGGLVATTLSTNGYVAKYSGVDGRYLWSRPLPTYNATGVAVDQANNIFITGRFMGTVDLGRGPLTSAGATDFLIAKYGADGSLLWASRYGGIYDEATSGIGVDSQGNIFIVGVFLVQTDLGGGALAGNGNASLFVAHYSGADGHHLWSRVIVGTGTTASTGLGIDLSGNVTITGSFAGAADFGRGQLASTGSADIFVAKYSGVDGRSIWARAFGGSADDIGNAVATDSSGNVLIAGNFNSPSVNFGGGALLNSGADGLFLLKLRAADGSYMWANSFASRLPTLEDAHSVAVDSSDNAILGGTIIGDIDFGGTVLAGNLDRDIFIATLSASSGAVLSAKRFVGWSEQRNTGLVLDRRNGNTFLSGTSIGSVDFGKGLINSPNSKDGVLAKFAASAQVAPPTPTPTASLTPVPITNTPVRTATPTRTPTFAAIPATDTPIRTPTNAGTPTRTPTVTKTPPATATPPNTATPFNTPLPGSVALLDGGVAAGAPGGLACLPVTLRSNGQTVATTTTNIGFADGTFSLQSWSLNPGLANKQLTHTRLGFGLDRLAVAGSANPLPDGLLYTLSFTINPSAGPGTYPVSDASVASDPSGTILSYPNLQTKGGELRVTQCPGDCNGDGVVTIGEVTRCTNLFQGQPLCDMADAASSCPVADVDGNQSVSIGEVILCVKAFTDGCPAAQVAALKVLHPKG